MVISATLMHIAPSFFLVDSVTRLYSPRLGFISRRATTSNRRPGKNFIAFCSNLASERKDIHKSNGHISILRRSSSTDPWIHCWGRTQLPKPRAVIDYGPNAVSSDEEEVGTSRSSGSRTMARIVEKLKKFGYIQESHSGESGDTSGLLPERGSVDDVFFAEDGVVPDTRGGLSVDLNAQVLYPWEKPHLVPGTERGDAPRRRRRTSVAEMTLPEGELRRLRHVALRTKSKIRVKGRGVTNEVVDKIHEKWRTEEVARIKCEGPLALNMKRMHEILEMKTGGLVIWRSGTSVSLYRGVTYGIPKTPKKYLSKELRDASTSRESSQTQNHDVKEKLQVYDVQDPSQPLDALAEMKVESRPVVNYELEMDQLLDGLGPRYTDWPGCDPLPVDADLLPSIPGYKQPFRVLPYGVPLFLRPKDATALRRLARSLPPHFALGRSRKHEGLAAAMVKLWEKSLIAKIALKRGVQLTSSERMAEEIKKLTGGTLLSRNKDYLVFYRGKDFLSPDVAEALLERERLAKTMQDEEERARIRAFSSVTPNTETISLPGCAGTLDESLEAKARWASELGDDYEERLMRATQISRHNGLVRKLELKLFIAERRLQKAGNALAKVEEFLKPVEKTKEPESITDEERFMFRKLGLKMKAILLLGRRGVFDGTIENMHLHWKYRELVKILVKAKTFVQVKNIALSLEAESGGVLVSVDKVSKGFAIVLYRGKSYQRPSSIRPRNLLSKRKALARSIELQRLEALNDHASKLRKKVERLKSELVQLENVEEDKEDELYSKLDSAYSTEEEDAENDQDDDSLLKATFDGLSDEEDDDYEHDEDGAVDDQLAKDADDQDDNVLKAAFDGLSDEDEDDFDGKLAKDAVSDVVYLSQENIFV